MKEMFSNAISFNQNLNDWDVIIESSDDEYDFDIWYDDTEIVNISNMFSNTQLEKNNNLPHWYK